MNRLIILSFAFFLAFMQVQAQQKHPLPWFKDYQQQNKATILQDYIDFIAIPNIAVNKLALQNNAEYLMRLMQSAGIEHTRFLFPEDESAPPVVYGEVIVPGARQTIVFYAHYDGQPVDSANWHIGLHPFQPALYSNKIELGGRPLTKDEFINNLQDEFRIYARGAADDKAGVMAIINAYIALKKKNIAPAVNVKFFFEGEEEAGSPHLAEVLFKYKNLLCSDVWIICDGPQPSSGKNLISFGVRGDTHIDITLYGSKFPLHSGHYGNWAPNPAWNLVRLLSSMKNNSGYVTIKNFYSDVTPLSNLEKNVLAQLDQNDEELKHQFGFIMPEMKNIALSEAILLPTLNINGIESGKFGALSTNSIPATASVSLDLRLVPGNDYKVQQERVIKHIQDKGYYIINRDPTDAERMAHPFIAKVICSDGYNAQKTPMYLPVSQQIIHALAATSTKGLVIMPSTGGSLPLYVIEQQLNAKAISIPIANYDDNQHAANENIQMGNFWNGIQEIISIMIMQ
ncbi:MAG: M20/M25/M40 family metallo-hydrolase [Sphingobacteriales bacterium]|uniref:M20/M25/M40 family metallo-hydrolase n=1 Tax=Hydrotalea flava TaxID=714549 RepID=UPI00082B9CC7|nr:M20/M25/M40 family metallo-hydrolase [Hydrotalea flava]RTL51049.1 MAG: M20/M25/M40 family metallo-hydrolase [Sphingobacteriales bacterium]